MAEYLRSYEELDREEVGLALRIAGEMGIMQIDRSLNLLNRDDGKKKRFAFVGMDREFVLVGGECAICILAMAKSAKLAKGRQVVTYRHKVV